MNYKEAINISQIWAARGYDEAGVCVVAIAYYGDEVLWLPGFGGNWEKTWEPLDDPKKDAETLRKRHESLEGLKFYPTGPKPDEQIQAELLEILDNSPTPPSTQVSVKELRAALEEIADEYEWADEMKDDYFEPMGETYE